MASMLHHDSMLLAHIILFLIYYKECKKFLNISNNSTWKKSSFYSWINFIEDFKKKRLICVNQAFLDTVQQKWNMKISKMKIEKCVTIILQIINFYDKTSSLWTQLTLDCIIHLNVWDNFLSQNSFYLFIYWGSAYLVFNNSTAIYACPTK